jgi:hypothetical protein
LRVADAFYSFLNFFRFFHYYVGILFNYDNII